MQGGFSEDFDIPTPNPMLQWAPTWVDREGLNFFSPCGVDIRLTYNVYGLGPVRNVLRWRPSFGRVEASRLL